MAMSVPYHDIHWKSWSDYAVIMLLDKAIEIALFDHFFGSQCDRTFSKAAPKKEAAS